MIHGTHTVIWHILVWSNHSSRAFLFEVSQVGVSQVLFWTCPWDAFVDSAIFASDLLISIITALSARKAIGCPLSKKNISVGILKLDYSLMHFVEGKL